MVHNVLYVEHFTSKFHISNSIIMTGTSINFVYHGSYSYCTLEPYLCRYAINREIDRYFIANIYESN